MEIALRRAMGKESGGASSKASRKRAQREKLRAAQDDLLSRTLRVSQEIANE
jgi:hypothetical protein